MWIQAAGLFLTAFTREFKFWLLGSLLLGIGTAMVYPSLIAAVSDASHPTWRARSLSVYRFWRDLGYAIGALSAGIIADILGLSWAIGTIAALTFLSGLVVALLMRERSVGSLALMQRAGIDGGIEQRSKDDLRTTKAKP
jgi:MFS family permease